MSQLSQVRRNWSRVLGSRVPFAHSGSEGLAELAVGETPKTVKLECLSAEDCGDGGAPTGKPGTDSR